MHAHTHMHMHTCKQEREGVLGRSTLLKESKLSLYLRSDLFIEGYFFSSVSNKTDLFYVKDVWLYQLSCLTTLIKITLQCTTNWCTLLWYLINNKKYLSDFSFTVWFECVCEQRNPVTVWRGTSEKGDGIEKWSNCHLHWQTAQWPTQALYGGRKFTS